MAISALPPSPSRLDAPDVFSDKADAFLGALPAFVTQANALQTDVNSKQSAAATSATTATNAAQAINSALNRYTFSTTTTMADPGVGVIRFNNATASSATAIAIDAQSADTGNPNILNLLLSFGDSTNNPKGLIRFTQAGTPANYCAYNVTAVTNNTGWVQFTVTHVAGAGSFSDGVSLVMEFHRAGNAGDVQLSANNTFTGNNSFNNATVISADSVAPALRITQTGSGNCLSVEDSASPDTTQFVIDSEGRVGIGQSPGAGDKLRITGVAPSSGTYSLYLNNTPTFDPAITTVAGHVFQSSPSVSSGTTPTVIGYHAQQGTFTGTVTNQFGFSAAVSLTGATNNYGFYGSIPAGAGRWNFYAAGTAPNYFAGETTVSSGFTIGRSGVTSPSASDGNVFSGTYTPTLTNVSNLTSSTAFQCQYMRVGDVVTVSGSASITPTSSGVVTKLGLSLPVTPSPSFTGARMLGGTFASSNASQRAGVIYADTTNNRAELQVTADVSAGITIFFNFTYRVAS